MRQSEYSPTILYDLPPGEYPLLIGLYDFEALDALPVNDQLWLTTPVV